MGPMILRDGEHIYVDTPAVIYTVEQHPRYYPLLRPLGSPPQIGGWR